jgi:hypothetical protein
MPRDSERTYTSRRLRVHSKVSSISLPSILPSPPRV